MLPLTRIPVALTATLAICLVSGGCAGRPVVTVAEVGGAARA